MTSGNIETIEIFDVSVEGQGVGRAASGAAVFVDGALPGDIVECEIVKRKKRFCIGNLLRVAEPSPERCESFCRYSSECGGCTFSEYSYEGELALKEKRVRDCLTRIAGITDPDISPIVGMSEGTRYRNKGTVHLSKAGEAGFFRKKSHEVVNCEECRLQREPVMIAAEVMRRHPGNGIRTLTVRTASGTGEVMVILGTAGKISKEALNEIIADLDENITGADDGVMGSFSLESVFLDDGRKMKLAAGKPTIRESLSGMEFDISPGSFFQVNPEQMVKLYDVIYDYADLKGGENVLDLYCGGGTIGLYLLKKLAGSGRESSPARVIGIESVRRAVLDANRNAALNGIVDAAFVHGKAEEVLPRMMNAETEQLEGLDYNSEALFKALESGVDLAILDPPRAGCDEALLSSVAEANPAKVIYVSCDPGTLARDVKKLMEMGYRFVTATPVDMFPRTGHVEVVSLLQRVSNTPERTITLDVEMEDYHRIKNRTEVTADATK